MKAITLHQPWASLIAHLLKTIETRRHGRFRCLAGKTIAIHAGLEWSGGRNRWAWLKYGLTEGDILDAWNHAVDYPGCVVAVADVTAHRRLTDADSQAALCPADGLYGLILDNVRRFETPIKAKGHQGIWTWEPPENWRGLVTT